MIGLAPHCYVCNKFHDHTFACPGRPVGETVLDYGDLSRVRTERDREGVGERLAVYVGDVLVWVHHAAFDPPLSEDAQRLFAALERWVRP